MGKARDLDCFFMDISSGLIFFMVTILIVTAWRAAPSGRLPCDRCRARFLQFDRFHQAASTRSGNRIGLFAECLVSWMQPGQFVAFLSRAGPRRRLSRPIEIQTFIK
jgi:hypothetical protein